MRPKKRRQRRQDRLNQATLEDIIRDNPDLFRGGNVNLLPEAEVEGTYGEVNQRRRRRRKEFIEDLPEVGKEVGFEMARMLPLLGDAIDVAEVGRAVETGKDFYGEETDPKLLAGLTAAGFLVPNIIEKPLKKAFKPLKRLFKKVDNPKVDELPNRTGFGVESKWHPGIKPLPDADMNDVERAYHSELNRVKNEIDTDEGRKRVKKMILDEVKFLEADPNTPKRVRESITPLLYDKDLLDLKVQEVFWGGKERGSGFMNTAMKRSEAEDRANYIPFRNAITPDSDLMSADHEMAHSIQYNILQSLGMNTKRPFRVGERVDLQKQGFRSPGSRGTTLDRDILKGVQMTDDPKLLLPRKFNESRPRLVKTYAEEGFDVDPLSPNNPRESIRLENALRGHRTNEPYPILAADRRGMIEEGILPSRHTPVTEDMIERFRETKLGLKNLGAPTDFSSKTTRSFANRRMAELMNRMPALIPALTAGGYLASQRGNQQQNGF